MRFDPETSDVLTHREERIVKQRHARKKRELLNLVQRLVKMDMEGLALFVPLITAVPFHESEAHIRMLIGSNRAGKTLHAAAEFAAVLSGVKYGAKGSAQVVGLDGDHLANPMLSKLIDEDAFNIIRDEQTRLWRAVRPDPSNPTRLDPYDDAYREKWKSAPPLLAPRLIKDIAWEDVRKRIPRYVRTVGWESLWRSSKGKPSLGRDFDYFFIDEQIENEQFYYEGMRGLTDRHGHLVWSATPQNTNPILMDLLEKAEDGHANFHTTTLLISENPYLSDAAKQQFYDAIPEEERQVRWFGKPAILGRMIYSYQPMTLHGVDRKAHSLPEEWTRYAVVDPGGGGRQGHVGCLHLAVDPEEKHIWVYDGYETSHTDAAKWAAGMKQREPRYGYEALVIDQQAGQQKPMAAAKTVAQQYSEALQAAGVEPHTKGPMYGFMRGSKDVLARTEALKGWMTVRDLGTGMGAGTAKLKVLHNCSEKLDRQLKRAQYDDNGKRVTKYPEDVLVCLEYAAGYDPRYIERSGKPSGAYSNPVLDLLRKRDSQTTTTSY